MSAAAGNAIRRERATVVACLLLVAAASWAWLLSGAGTMEEMDGMLMPMSSGPWTAGHAAIMIAMWAVMMAAMMLPTAVPMVLFYTTIAHRQRSQGHAGGSALFFTAGYVAIWAAFSAAATALQFGLEHAALLSPMMEATSAVFAGCIMIGAGLYQWMPLKRACLQRCRSPLDFVLENWRGGKAGALQMGFKHGLYCLGCCWVLMLLLFVGGVMNLAWIAGIALFVLVEKLAPAGHWIGRAAGVLMIVWGTATLLAPVLLPRAG